MLTVLFYSKVLSTLPKKCGGAKKAPPQSNLYELITCKLRTLAFAAHQTKGSQSSETES